MFLNQPSGVRSERLPGRKNLKYPDISVNKAITKLAISFLVALSASLLYFAQIAQNHLR